MHTHKSNRYRVRKSDSKMPTLRRVAIVCGQEGVTGAAMSAAADDRGEVRGMALCVGALSLWSAQQL